MLKIYDMKTYLLCAALTAVIYGLFFTFLLKAGAGVNELLAGAIPLTIMVIILNLAILEKYRKL